MFLACLWCEVQKRFGSFYILPYEKPKWHIYLSRKNKLEDLFTLELKDLKKISEILGYKSIVWVNSE